MHTRKKVWLAELHYLVMVIKSFIKGELIALAIVSTFTLLGMFILYLFGVETQPRWYHLYWIWQILAVFIAAIVSIHNE